MTQKDNTNCGNETFTETDLPRYEQIKQSILEHIRAHELKPGNKLPTEAELCRMFGWSRVTISRALNELERDGVVNRVRGSGTYLAEKKIPDHPLRIMVSEMALKPGKGYREEVYFGIREAAAHEKVDILYYPGDEIPDPQAVTGSNTDGLLLLSSNMEHIPAILKLRETGRPVVTMAMRSRFASLATVCTDNFGGMVEAVTHMVKLGHRRIALATSGLISSDVQERIEGFHSACFNAGIPVDPTYLLLFDRMIGARILEAWFDSLWPRPTAIIVDYRLAFPIQHILWNRNLQVPQDVSLIVTDDSDLFRGCNPQLTVIRQPLVEMGRHGLRKLIKILKGEDDGKPDILPMEFIVRDSVAPVCGTK